MDAFFVVIGWIVGTVGNGMIADRKGLDVAGAVVSSVFLRPLVTWGYLVAVPAEADQA